VSEPQAIVAEGGDQGRRVGSVDVSEPEGTGGLAAKQRALIGARSMGETEVGSGVTRVHQ
jgi:hypothetical protein